MKIASEASAKRTSPASQPVDTPRKPTVASQLTGLKIAFQPIVNMHTGMCLGYEALLRGYEQYGFADVPAFLDDAFVNGRLQDTEDWLHQCTIDAFRRIPHASQVKLFMNLDYRLFSGNGHSGNNGQPDSEPLDRLVSRLHEQNVHPASLCIEISERIHIGHSPFFPGMLTQCRREMINLALDDFGIGVSGMHLMYMMEPDFIKIDRFFIHQIAEEPRKRVFAASMINLAHRLGILVIAEGVETLREFRTCRELGCDLVQGYFIARPTVDRMALTLHSPEAENAARADRRTPGDASDQSLVNEQIDMIVPIQTDAPLVDVLELFRRNKQRSFFPVVNAINEPVGIIRERELKDIVYSQFGRDLLRNRGFPHTLADYVQKCQMADVRTPASQILEIFSRGDTSEGMIIMRDMKYAGFLSAPALLKILNEKNILTARDQNPLTRLPGNFQVNAFLQRASDDGSSCFIMVYYDFDNFKPFNDTYGFREGDRAILLFSDILKKEFQNPGHFVGHIGGDDFFIGLMDVSAEYAGAEVRRVAERFRHDVESFYPPEDRQRGYITMRARDGIVRQFPLLTVSAAVGVWPAGSGESRSTETFSRVMSELKKAAKQSENHFCLHSFGTGEENGPNGIAAIGK